jgi:hypothetical protein
MNLVAMTDGIRHSLLMCPEWLSGSSLLILLFDLWILLTFSWNSILGALIFLFITRLGLGVIISFQFGSGVPWILRPLLEE